MPSPRPVRRRRRPIVAAGLSAGLAAAVLAVGADPASGQFRIRRGRPMFVPPPADATAQNDKDAPKDAPPVGVSVPISTEAADLLQKAQDKEQQKEWSVAADFYREAVQKHPDRVIAVDVDHAKNTYRYAGVAAVVQERVARWPAAGLAVYRNRFGPAAADKLAAAGRGDLAAVWGVFYDDFVTDAGKGAGLRLADAYAEAGDFAAAAAVGDRLLDLHPSLGGDRPAVLFRTALADHWAGDDAAANRRLADLRQTDAKAVGTVGGKDVVLADALAAAVATPAPRPAVDPAAADTYPSFGGPGGRGDVSPSVAKPGASLNTIALAQPTFAGPQRRASEEADRGSVAAGQATGIIPVADAGALFFQDGRWCYAVDADTGRPLPGWARTYPGDLGGGGTGGRYPFNGPTGRARGEQLTLTVTPSAVLAVMGQRDRLSPYGGAVAIAADGTAGSGGPARLVCLDRDTGRERWKASPADLPESAGAARATDYVGTPLAVPAAAAGTAGGTGNGAGNGTGNGATDGDDAVLVAARGGKDQFDACYVVCLSARTGRYRWSTYVGSGVRSAFDGGDTVVTPDPSQLSLAGGRAFVMTNLGTVAALDPADGRILWLSAYPRTAVDPSQELMGQPGNPGGNGPARPWSRNPVVVQGGRVFALPTDAKQLFVLDAATGKRVQQVELADLVQKPTTTDEKPEPPPDVLLGVRDKYAVLVGTRTIYGVDWRGYDHDAAAAAVWRERPFGPDLGDKRSDSTAMAGRGFLTADGFYVVNGERLSEIDWRRHKIVAEYPAAGTFEQNGHQEPGNILATGQNVVVAGRDRVDVYTDLGLVTARYQREMAAAPDDPQPRVRFANALFAGGKTTDAVAKVDDAVRLLGGPGAMRPGPGRQLVFDTLLDFARRSAGPRPDAAVAPLVDGLFDRASTAADGPDQTVAYLLARAKFDHDLGGRSAAEVELAQRILSDPALRPVAVTDDQSAAAAATAAVAAAVAVDHTAYAPVEARAAAAAAEAKAKADPDALLAVAVEYPNSRAAADAREAAVGQYLATNRPLAAADVLRQTYGLLPDPVQRPAVLQRIAAALLATGPDGVGPAADRMAWAAELAVHVDGHLAADFRLPDGTVLRGGTDTYAAAVDALRRDLAEQATAALPDLRLATNAQALAHYAAQHPSETKKPTNDKLSPFVPTAGAIADVVTLVHPDRAYGRNDRVVTWSPAGLAAYAVGHTTPAFVNPTVTDAPIGAAWMAGGRLVVWTPTRLVAVAEDGRDAWPAAIALGGLSPLPVVSTGVGGAVVDDGPAAPVDVADADNVRQVVVNGQVVNIRVNGGGGQIVGGLRVIRNGQVVFAPPPNGGGGGPGGVEPAPRLDGGEQIVFARPAGRAAVVVATTRGRVLCVDAATGIVRWQARPTDRPADALVANGHYAVVRTDDPGGAQVIVYDVATGRTVGRRKFGADNQPTQLVNVALGEEATLAFTLANSIEVKDLYDPWPAPPITLTARAYQDPAPYTGLSQPDQLLVQAGRVVALYAAGGNWRAWDLARSVDNPINPMPAANPPTPNVWLRLDGPRLTLTQPSAVYQFDLSVSPVAAVRPDDSVGIRQMRVRGLIVGRHHVVAIDDPVDRGPAPSPAVTVIAYGRDLIPGTATIDGKLEFCFRLASRAGIADYLPVDGGVYFLAGDHRLVLMKGGRDD